MSDSMTTSQWLCLATIGVVLVPQYHALPTKCPTVTCKPGQQSQTLCGPCVPCPEGHYQPDEVQSDFGQVCMPFIKCGEGAVRDCSLNGRQCLAHEAQHCECDLDKNYFGSYPNCALRTSACPEGTKLDTSGACVPTVSHPSFSPDTSPPSTPVTGSPHGHGAGSTSTITESVPAPLSTPATPAGTPKTDIPNCSTPENRGAGHGWTMLSIGIVIGVVAMVIIVSVTVCIVVCKWRPVIYMSTRERHREHSNHNRDPEEISFQSFSIRQNNRSNSALNEAMNGDVRRPMLDQTPTEVEDPAPAKDDMPSIQLLQLSSVTPSEEEVPDTHPAAVN